jgi:hypothetical protein
MSAKKSKKKSAKASKPKAASKPKPKQPPTSNSYIGGHQVK